MNTSASHLDTVFKCLLTREVLQSTTTLCQLHHLLGCGEGERSRQGGFQVCLKELTVPAIPKHVIHVDIAEWLTSFSTFRAQSFSVVAGIRGKIVGTYAANLAGQPLPSRRQDANMFGGMFRGDTRVNFFNKRMFARQLMYLISGGRGPFSTSRRKSNTPAYLRVAPYVTAACSLGLCDHCNLRRPGSKYTGPCACRCHLTNTQP